MKVVPGHHSESDNEASGSSSADLKPHDRIVGSEPGKLRPDDHPVETTPDSPKRTIQMIQVPHIYAHPTPFLTSVRFRLALLVCMGFFVMYSQRVNLSITMVCMVKHTAKADSNVSSSSGNGDGGCGSLNVKHSDKGEFDWDKSLQGKILGAFFYGYLVLQLPGGILAQTIGSKVVIMVGMGIVAIMTLLTPLLVRINPYVYFAVRVVIGLGQGVMYPAAISFWGAWAPPKERTRLVAIALSGGQLGNALIFPAGGLICDVLGWDYVFYYSGTLGSIFVLLWMAWAKDDPHDHKGLSDDERMYLYSVIHTAETKQRSIPWKAIFTSLPTWAVFIAHTTGNYTYYMNLTQIPTYMKEILKFDLKANGFFSMLPYLVFWFTTFASGIFSDWLISRGMKISAVRKSFATIGLVGPAVSLMLTSLVTCEYKYMAVLTLCFAGGFTGFGFSSYMINHGDLAPCFAGTLFGISNTFATIPGIFAPTIVGKITSGGTVAQWQTAFGIAASLNVVGAVVFVLFGQVDIQPWAMDTPSHSQGLFISPVRRMSVALASH